MSRPSTTTANSPTSSPSASEKFSVYELKDKKPDLITFQLEDGTYILPTVVDKGYLQIGKHKLSFERKGRVGDADGG